MEPGGDSSWRRIPAERATEAHFGVRRGSDSFEFLYRARLPELTAPARMWLPLPESDGFQTVEVASNFLAYPVLEVDGRPAKAEVTFSFVRRAAD